MGLYGNKKDYQELVQENISKARILFSIPEKNRTLALELLKEKEKIIIENHLFANFKLRKIDKKLEKLKKN